MRPLSLFCLALILSNSGCVTARLAMDRPLDLAEVDSYRAEEGYGAAVWGMTPEELQSAVPGLSRCGLDVWCGRAEVAGKPANAGYAFVNGHLAQVVVSVDSSNPKQDFTEVAPTLHDQFGEPASKAGVSDETVGAVIAAVLLIGIVVIVAAALGHHGGGGSVGHLGAVSSGGSHSASSAVSAGHASGAHPTVHVGVPHGGDGIGQAVEAVAQSISDVEVEVPIAPPEAGRQLTLDGTWTQWRTGQSDVFLVQEPSAVVVAYTSRALEGYLGPPAFTLDP
jgi:hypothetical protein